MTTQVLIAIAEGTRPAVDGTHVGIRKGARVVPGVDPGVPVQPKTPDSPCPRGRTALAVLEHAEADLRRTARRFSLCGDDAEDAFQRAVEILLTKAPDRPPAALAPWMQVVTRREALAVRRSRERLLAGWRDDDAVGRVECDRPRPDEHAERRDRVSAAARALAALKPNERLAILLQAHGYSYAEIGELCGWTYTKVNRCLAEGRARLRELARCERL